ncbi:MAG: hypothetical protein JXM71_07315 [Spirochaetales bacterium]|nr:hypothetical protein [Spirochaetales bacterium]
MRVRIAVFVLALAAANAAAQTADIRAEFRVDLAAPPYIDEFEGTVDPAWVPRVPDAEAAAAVLAEARWVFGGMVWGFDYVYTPSDRARSIAEYFEMQATLGDAAVPMDLSVVSARLDGTALVAMVAYRPDAAASVELAAWKQTSAAAQGTGSAAALLSADADTSTPAQVAARRNAVLDAAREALRAYLRGVTHNKPREVRGSFAFASAPRLVLREGHWVATVRCYARVDEIVPYGAY